MIRVERIPKKETYPWLLQRHYARRIPQIQYAFGLFEGGIMTGCCTYGASAAATNNGKSLFVQPFPDTLTLELNRLIVDTDRKNAASQFLARTFKLLPMCALLSFADPNVGHVGYIYQATNWLYCGLSEVGGKDGTWIIGQKEYHSRSIVPELLRELFRDGYDEALGLRDNWEKNGGTIVRPERKHRYVRFIGSKRERKKMTAALRYEVLNYPKGAARRYDASADIQIQRTLF